MDAAVVDRIRGYADDGMPAARIAATLGLTEPEVERHLVGVARPMTGTKPTTNPPETPPPAVVKVRADHSADMHQAPADGRRGRLIPAPPKVGDRQREVWRLVTEEGLYQADVARRLGIHQGSVQSALRGWMRANGIEGPLPGAMPKDVAASRTAEAQRAAYQRRQPFRTGPVVRADDPEPAARPWELPPTVVPEPDHIIEGPGGGPVPATPQASSHPAPDLPGGERRVDGRDEGTAAPHHPDLATLAEARIAELAEHEANLARTIAELTERRASVLRDLERLRSALEVIRELAA